MTPTFIDHSNGGVEVERDLGEQTDFLLAQGYISPVGGNDDEEFGTYATSPEADRDPTLAENRESPTPVDQLKPHVANGGDEGDKGETVYGHNRGLDAKPVGNTDQAPDVEFKPGGASKASADEFEGMEYADLKARVAADKEAKGDAYDGPALNASADDLRTYLRSL